MRREYIFRESPRVLGKIETCQILRAIEALVHQGHRMYAVFHVAKDLNRGLISRVGRLKIEKAADNRQVVFNPVMNFSQ